MNLVMFDIDGTLTATTDIDEGCYVLAVEAVLNIDNIDTDLIVATEIILEKLRKKYG